MTDSALAPGPTAALLAHLIEPQVEQLINAALVRFHNGSLSAQEATNVIAQIAALRSLYRSLDQRLQSIA